MSLSTTKTKLLFPNDIFLSKHFDEWVELNRTMLHNVAKQWVAFDDADDCLEDALIDTWQSLPRLPQPCTLEEFFKFFYRKLRNACRAHQRRLERRSEVTIAPDDILMMAERMSTDSTLTLPNLSDPAYDKLREQLLTRLHRAALPRMQENCIRQALDGVTQAKIAEYFSISQQAVSAHIAGAAEKLKLIQYWEEDIDQNIAKYFKEFVEEQEALIYRRPSRSRKKFLQREKKSEVIHGA